MIKCKSILCLIMVLLLLLTACSTVPAETSSADTGIPEDTTTTAERDPADVIKGNDPCDIYFFTGNDYYDLYSAYSSSSQRIAILSRKYIAPEDISISIDVQTAYDVTVLPLKSTPDATAFPLYIYQNYAGMDWAELREEYEKLKAVYKKHETGEASYDVLSAAQNAYNLAASAYISEYDQLTLEDLPEYYQYSVYITFQNATEAEIFETVQITIGNTVYDVDIGQVRLRPSPPYGNMDLEGQYLRCVSTGAIGNTYPYGVGIEKYRSDSFCTQQPLTLTGLTFLEDSLSTLELLDVELVIADNRDDLLPGNGITISWDGKTPVFVEQGKYFRLFYTIHDERMKEIAYGAKLYPILEYTCGESNFMEIPGVILSRESVDTWLLYAMCLDGINMESYFENYYYKIVDTRFQDIDITDTWESRRQAE